MVSKTSKVYTKKASNGGSKRASVGRFTEAKQHRQLDGLGRSPISPAQSLHSGNADEGAQR